MLASPPHVKIKVRIENILSWILNLKQHFMQERASKESLVATDVTALALDFTDKPVKLVRNHRNSAKNSLQDR